MGAALDADDTFMMLHFGVPTVAAALAVTEIRRGTGRELLEAVAVGFEVGARVLRAFGPLVSLRHGRIAGYARPLWAPVPLVFGAVGATARALGLARDAVAEAFAIAAANTPVPVAHKWAEDAGGRPLGTYKYVDAGQCAAVGVEAALLAAAGLTGIPGLFDGRDGFWQVCGCRQPDRAAFARTLGNRWQVLETSYKPWPSCRWLHYPLTALTHLLAREPIAAGEVEEIVVQAPAMALAPQHVARTPAGWVAAQFSHPHSVAMVLLGVPPGVEWYAAATLARADVRELRRRVRVEPHPSSRRLDGLVEDGQFTRLPSAVEVRGRGGRRRAVVERAKGDPWDPSTRLSDGELVDKLGTLAVWPAGGARQGAGRRTAPDARDLGRAVLGLAEVPRLDGITAENLATKATAAVALRWMLAREGIERDAVDYVISTSEEAVGDRYQRGGGNLGKAVAELAGCRRASGADVKDFCAGPLVGVLMAASLVQAGVFRTVAVVGGGSLAKLGMKYSAHLAKGLPILEDVLAATAVLVTADDGASPVLRLDSVATARVADESSPIGLTAAVVGKPLRSLGLRFTAVDRYVGELHNPEITMPAGGGDVPDKNYRMIAACAVAAGELGRDAVAAFVADRGVPGFAPTQGHVASAVCFMPHAVEMLRAGALRRTLFVAKASCFLGRMTQSQDGISFLLEARA